MALDTASLDEQLGELKQQTQHVLLLKHKTRKEERTHLATIYVWWRTVREQGTYLDDKYAELAIPNNKLQNKINFRPFLTLVTGGNVSKNDLNFWQITLNAVHAEWEARPDHYATDTIDRIVHFINEQGGKTGIASYHVDDAEDAYVDDVVEDKQVKHWVDELDDAEFMPTWIARAKAHYGSRASNISVDLQQVQATPDGFSLVIVHQNGTTTNLLGSVNDDTLIDELLTSKYRNDFSVMPKSMRMVLEPLHLLNVPEVIAASADQFVENSRVKDALIEGKKVVAVKRLTYRMATEDFLLSNVCMDSGVVIRAKPKTNLFGKVQGDLCLSNTMRQSVETRLLYKHMFNMYTTTSPDKFLAYPEGHIYAYKLPLQCTFDVSDDEKTGIRGSEVAQHISNIAHPPIDWMPFYTDAPQLHWQVDAIDDPFTPTWVGHASSYWLRTTVCEFFDKWIAAYAKKSNRPVNKTLLLNLMERSFVVGYEMGQDGMYVEDNDKRFNLDNGRGVADVQVRSTDFAFAMRQLADLDLLGGVHIGVNAHAVKLQFQTSVHSYTCWVPTCDSKGVRDKTSFKRYMPSQTQLHKEWGDDNANPNLTDEEEEQLRTQGKLV